MALGFTILVTFLIGSIVVLIYGKYYIKRIIAPLFIVLIADFLLLYAKLVVGDDILTLIIYLPAMILFVISLIWLLVILVKSFVRKDSKKKIIAILLCIAMTTVIIYIPSLRQEDKFKIYQDEFMAVSDAIFKAYDEGRVSIGEEFASPPYATYDLDRLSTLFSDKILNKMKKVNRSAGVYTYILADKDVIYFSFGAVFQSISGIAICRNGKDPSTDETLKSRFFDGNTSFEYISNGAYHFSDGL
ncbi:hypothetical protein [Paenibacillus antarcticus]|uniref:Uncharacterized protein n=1 Tax=Paenibacillus antarcticus TaxID=253703 RepID=A0A162LVK9_9BACL|nr:hypothetical protein [Paenibacillus antarcticus]OAB40397.1 hypothetical protein PBAT_24165 [Paenibacillus antarcticus]